MADLQKQRELKYINLKCLRDQEDPKEELIIQMPEFQTQVDHAFEREKKRKVRHELQKETVPFLEMKRD